MNKLVIVESPNKIKSIEKYLGTGYKVMASKGHIVVLPSKGKGNFGVDMETWTPKYEIDPDKKKVVDELKKEVKNSDHVYIATDPDREGEAIGENLATFLELEPGSFSRITYNEITESAIKKAMEKPTEIDYKLVEAQVTRRIIDRIIGYKLSGLLRRKIYGAPTSPSAGRVQSIALKLVIEKEKLIDAFVPVKYFQAQALIKDDYQAELYIEDSREKKTWIKPEEIDEIERKFNGSLIVKSVKTTTKKDAKKTPFKQSSLYKAADSKLNMSSNSAQSSMQKLFEDGIISYPRTDSTKLSNTFVESAKEYISKTYGAENVSKSIKGTSGDQNAHEAIRPTDVKLTPKKAAEKYALKGSDLKLYELIWTHTLQTIMNVPVREMLRYNLEENGNLFKLTSSKVIEMGYFLVSGYEASRELPVFKEGEVITVDKYNVEAKETKPPARYNDGSLIEHLDEIKVGRPSTFATTINILKKRAYVSVEGKALKPTPFGKIVLEKLITNFPEIINEEYTASVEDTFDKIAEGKLEKGPFLDDFWIGFEKQMDSATQTIEITKIKAPEAGKDCPECGAPLLIRTNKKQGTTFFGCSAFPKCKHIESDPNSKKVFFKKKWPTKK